MFKYTKVLICNYQEKVFERQKCITTEVLEYSEEKTLDVFSFQ